MISTKPINTTETPKSNQPQSKTKFPSIIMKKPINEVTDAIHRSIKYQSTEKKGKL
jgi:hypothetical protein